MKRHTLILSILCLVGVTSVRGQVQPQVDTVPVPSPWVRVNLSSEFGGDAGIDYLSPDTCWGACDSGQMISIDGGIDWTLIRTYLPNGGRLMRNAHEGYSIWWSGRMIYKTVDAWKTWDSVAFPAINAFGSAMIVDSLHAFVCGGNSIGRTTNAGKTWDVTDLTGFVGYVSFADSLHGFAISDDLSYWYTTTDGGNSWPRANTRLIGGVSGIAAINPRTVVLLAHDSIYRSTDAGGSWKTSAIPELPGFAGGWFLSIAMHGAFGIVAGDKGTILSTNDTGQTWVQEPSGITGSTFLANVQIYDSSLASVIASDGSALIRRPGTLGVNQQPTDSIAMSAFPNPAQDLVTIQYTLPLAQHVSAKIFDVQGNLISIALQNSAQDAGVNSVRISTSSLSNGVYFLEISSESYASAVSITVQK